MTIDRSVELLREITAEFAHKSERLSSRPSQVITTPEGDTCGWISSLDSWLYETRGR